MVQTEEVFEDAAVGGEPLSGEGVIGWQGLPGASVGPDSGPIGGPVSFGVGGGVGGEDGAVELFVGEIEPGGTLVVEVGEGAVLEAGVVRVMHETGKPIRSVAGSSLRLGACGWRCNRGIRVRWLPHLFLDKREFPRFADVLHRDLRIVNILATGRVPLGFPL